MPILKKFLQKENPSFRNKYIIKTHETERPLQNRYSNKYLSLLTIYLIITGPKLQNTPAKKTKRKPLKYGDIKFFLKINS